MWRLKLDIRLSCMLIGQLLRRNDFVAQDALLSISIQMEMYCCIKSITNTTKPSEEAASKLAASTTLFQPLQTRQLPISPGLVGYCWRYSGFYHLVTLRANKLSKRHHVAQCSPRHAWPLNWSLLTQMFRFDAPKGNVPFWGARSVKTGDAKWCSQRPKSAQVRIWKFKVELMAISPLVQFQIWRHAKDLIGVNLQRTTPSLRGELPGYTKIPHGNHSKLILKEFVFRPRAPSK